MRKEGHSYHSIGEAADMPIQAPSITFYAQAALGTPDGNQAPRDQKDAIVDDLAKRIRAVLSSTNLDGGDSVEFRFKLQGGHHEPPAEGAEDETHG